MNSKIHKPYKRKHGHAGVDGKSSRTRTYASWASMHDRCSRPKTRGYNNYGGAGVKVCARWSGSRGFEFFLADMGLRPEGTTLGRVGDTGNYSPENCHWQRRRVRDVTRRINASIRVSKETAEMTRRYTAGKTLRAIAAEFGTNRQTVSVRLKRAGVKFRPKWYALRRKKS